MITKNNVDPNLNLFDKEESLTEIQIHYIIQKRIKDDPKSAFRDHTGPIHNFIDVRLTYDKYVKGGIKKKNLRIKKIWTKVTVTKKTETMKSKIIVNGEGG